MLGGLTSHLTQLPSKLTKLNYIVPILASTQTYLLANVDKVSTYNRRRTKIKGGHYGSILREGDLQFPKTAEKENIYINRKIIVLNGGGGAGSTFIFLQKILLLPRKG
jgi:hypothetical protein